MYDFDDISATSKDEQIRAWCVEKALESFVGTDATDEEIVNRAHRIFEFLTGGFK